MQYLLRESSVYRAASPESDRVEKYAHSYKRWLPHGRRRDIGSYKIISAEQAIEELISQGASEEEARKAVES